MEVPESSSGPLQPCPLPAVSRSELKIPPYNPSDDIIEGVLKLRKIVSNTPQQLASHAIWTVKHVYCPLKIPSSENYSLYYTAAKTPNNTPNDSFTPKEHIFPCAGARLVIHDSQTFALHSLSHDPLTFRADSEVEAYQWTTSLAHILTVADLRQVALLHIDSFTSETAQALHSLDHPPQEDETLISHILQDYKLNVAAANDDDDDDDMNTVEDALDDEEEDSTTKTNEKISLPQRDSLVVETCCSPRMSDEALAELYNTQRDLVVYVPSPESVLSYQSRSYDSNSRKSHRSRTFSTHYTNNSIFAILQVFLGFVVLNILYICTLFLSLAAAVGMFFLSMFVCILFMPWNITIFVVRRFVDSFSGFSSVTGNYYKKRD